MVHSKLFFLLLIALATGCVQFQTARLYEGVEVTPEPPKPRSVSAAVEPIIFNDNASYFWVTDNPACTWGGPVQDVSYSGETSLKISWNRDPAVCEWAGFGIGWDNWAGKDLSALYPHAAIQFHVRTQEGRAYGLPMVLTLEDYSGKMAWSYVSNKYFERYYLDEEWQRIAVPLNTFDLDEDGIDLFNVKQLMFELQQAGGIYIDDIQLIFYEPEPTEVWLPELATPALPEYPVTLFDDSFINDNGWGLYSDPCQQITLTTDHQSSGQKAIHAVWDSEISDCYTVALGVSWRKWHSIDLRADKASVVVEFDVRMAAGQYKELPIIVELEDYERRKSGIRVSAEYIEGGLVGTGWTKVQVPLTALSGDADFGNIKQLVLRMQDSGDLYLDRIRLVKQ